MTPANEGDRKLKLHHHRISRAANPIPTSSEIMNAMRTHRLAFFVFAAAILFSMIREWSAPVACVRSILVPAVATQNKH